MPKNVRTFLAKQNQAGCYMWDTGNDKNSNFYNENRFIKRTYCCNCLHGPVVTTYLRTKLKFIYISGSQQLNLVLRNKEPY